MSAALPLLQGLARSADALARGGYLLVQDGDAFAEPPDTVPLPTGASARVVRIGSELALRHALWKHDGLPLVALVPGSLQLPADLLQAAERHRVHTLTGDEVLSAVLRTRVVGVDDAELRELALEHAAAIQAHLERRTTPTAVDRALLERMLVEVVDELEDLRLAQDGPGVLLAAWVRRPPAWRGAVARLAAASLRETHGEPGRALGWVLGDPHTRAHAMVVYGAVLSADGEVPAAAWGPLAPLADPASSPLRAHGLARDQVVSLAREAAEALGHAARPLLDEADGLARSLVQTSMVRGSTLLPAAFEDGAQAVASALAAGELVAPEQLAWLRGHVLAHTEAARLGLLEHLARLVRYLTHPRESAPRATALAAAYLADHAHADACARLVERSLASVAAHHAEAGAVLDRVYAARDAANEAFATALAQNYEGTLFSREDGCIGLHKVTGDVVRPRLSQPRCERTFLVVLDGCSVPVFLDLLEQLADPEKPHRIGLELGPAKSLRLRPGLAPLPTITSHARGALFVGNIPEDAFVAETQWKQLDERKTDPARFRQNPELGGASRQLFLKGDLSDGGRGLTQALVGDTAVVAAVFNAVDDRIGSHDTGAAWRMQVEDITGLLPALHAALDHGRTVLLTADHGHTPFRSKALRVGPGSTPRYLSLGRDAVPPPGFLEVDTEALTGRPGRTAFAWRSGVYRGSIQVGFHGGCALEEVVVPVAWLARNGPAADRPAWWEADAAAVPPRRAAPPPPRRPRPSAAPPPASAPPASPPPASEPPAPPPAVVPASASGWLDRIPSGPHRTAMAYLAEHGACTERELTQLLGGARKVRSFSRKVEALSALAPFRVCVQALPDGNKRFYTEQD